MISLKRIVKKAQLGLYLKKSTINDENPVVVRMVRGYYQGVKIYYYVRDPDTTVIDDALVMSSIELDQQWVKLAHSGLPPERIVKLLPERVEKVRPKPSRTKSSKSVIKRIKRILSDHVDEDKITVVQHMMGSLINNRDDIIDYYQRENERINMELRKARKQRNNAEKKLRKME